jgi:hypothetical protein
MMLKPYPKEFRGDVVARQGRAHLTQGVPVRRSMASASSQASAATRSSQEVSQSRPHRGQ